MGNTSLFSKIAEMPDHHRLTLHAVAKVVGNCRAPTDGDVAYFRGVSERTIRRHRKAANIARFRPPGRPRKAA